MKTESELEKFSPKIQKYFTLHFTCGESCILSKVDCNQRKSTLTLEVPIEFHWLQKEFLLKFFPIHFQSSKHISQLKHDLALSLLTYSTPWLETFSSSSQVTSERVAAEFEEIQNMSKLKAAAAEKERKLFLRHALERRKNVSKQNKSAKFPTDTLDTRSLCQCQS